MMPLSLTLLRYLIKVARGLIGAVTDPGCPVKLYV